MKSLVRAGVAVLSLMLAGCSGFVEPYPAPSSTPPAESAATTCEPATSTIRWYAAEQNGYALVSAVTQTLDADGVVTGSSTSEVSPPGIAPFSLIEALDGDPDDWTDTILASGRASSAAHLGETFGEFDASTTTDFPADDTLKGTYVQGRVAPLLTSEFTITCANGVVASGTLTGADPAGVEVNTLFCGVTERQLDEKLEPIYELCDTLPDVG